MGQESKKRQSSGETHPASVVTEVVLERPTDELRTNDDESVLEPDVIDIEAENELASNQTIEALVVDEEEDANDSAPQRQESLTPARYDSLSAYLNEISRHPMLDKSEEGELAKRFYEHKDRDAAYRLVVGNLWLVVKIARDYERAARNLLDVIQEGNIGLMEAVKNFDPYRGVRFPSYAVWWIKAYILRYILANLRMVKIGTTQAQRKLFFNLKKEKERLEREGFFPAPKLLAEKLNVKERDVLEMEQRLSSPDVSVYAPTSADGDLDLLSTLPDHQPSAEDIIQKRQMQSLVHDSLNLFREQLNERDQLIFDLRLLGEDKTTLNDLAEQFGISKERVRQLENRLREQLKTFLEEKMKGTLNEALLGGADE
jgi:RNA polymerase sigma-32 factor